MKKKKIEKKNAKLTDEKKKEEMFVGGVVCEIRDGVVYAKGLNKGAMSELVIFEEIGLKGMLTYIGKDKVGITVLGSANEISVGMKVQCLEQLAVVSVGSNLLGRVVNSLGEPIDGQGVIKKRDSQFIENLAPGIIERQSVNEPLETGVKFIDSMVPIGCGQRELIIGDPKTGKTSIALDTILNQKDKDMICVYVAIGQKQMSIAKVYNVLRKKNCMDKTIIVAAAAGESAVMQYLAPFTGCAIGEYFMNKFRKVLVIYDDLSKHAVAYRQMSLLLRRPPGREGYPGDVFYLHSRLLERAARLCDKEEGTKVTRVGGSLTALPVIETVEGDVAAYIPTNVISITDGQIFLETELFHQGIRPAISPGISVSRVGSAAQNKVIKRLAGSLKLDLAQYRELYQFVKLGMPLDLTSKIQLEKGERLQKLMIQPAYMPVKMAMQIILLFGGLKDMFSDLQVNLLDIFERKLMFLLGKWELNRIFTIMLPFRVPVEVVSFCINGLKAYSAELNS